MSPAPLPAVISLADVEKERADIFRQLLFNVLRCDIVNDIFAQIIDGLPTKETHEYVISGRADLMSRTEISQESRDRARKFCNPGEALYASLELNAKVSISPALLHAHELLANTVCPRLPNSIKMRHLRKPPSTCISSNFSQLQFMT